jgi:hypothetical protein
MARALSRLPDPVPPTVLVEAPVTTRVPGTNLNSIATGIGLPLGRVAESGCWRPDREK